jgi:hypothetical protein
VSSAPLVKSLLRQAIRLWPNSRRLALILHGPLCSYGLPKQIALDSLSMLFGRYDPTVVSTLLSADPPPRMAYD